jgi:hypothetical protein
VYNTEELIVMCDESKYVFSLNKDNKGIIKSGNYEIEITTFASKIEVLDTAINLNYELKQGTIVLGEYDLDKNDWNRDNED